MYGSLTSSVLDGVDERDKGRSHLQLKPHGTHHQLRPWVCSPPPHLAHNRGTCPQLIAQASHTIWQQQPLCQLVTMFCIIMFTGGNAACLGNGSANASAAGIPSHHTSLCCKSEPNNKHPLRSFGSMPQWYCAAHSAFCSLQCSVAFTHTGLLEHVSPFLCNCYKAISILQTQDFTMGKSFTVSVMNLIVLQVIIM